ncbi:MAG TPA: hypothetical protein VMV05_12100 [bacterium]|nr:hypothetical protein [bacterium]
MIILAAMGWEAAFQEKGKGPKWLFGVGVFFSLWLCVSAQWTTTAPYASALGMEDPLYRLKRHYSFDMETYAAYRYIEDRTTPEDKVMAFAVFQTYPLQRTAYVDFKWKKPIFLEWASRCQTAGQLAKKLREEGVSIFLYQKWEAEAMSKVEKDFKLEGMPIEEYKKFWKYYMEPKQILTNTCVYQVKNQPAERPYDISILPGLKERAPTPAKAKVFSNSWIKKGIGF